MLGCQQLWYCIYFKTCKVSKVTYWIILPGVIGPSVYPSVCMSGSHTIKATEVTCFFNTLINLLVVRLLLYAELECWVYTSLLCCFTFVRKEMLFSIANSYICAKHMHH